MDPSAGEFLSGVAVILAAVLFAAVIAPAAYIFDPAESRKYC